VSRVFLTLFELQDRGVLKFILTLFGNSGHPCPEFFLTLFELVDTPVHKFILTVFRNS
jgi:hypothetical protein